MHQEEAHPRIIARIEKSVSVLKQLAETTHNKYLRQQEAGALAKERHMKKENQPLLDISYRNAYKQLTDICLSLSKEKKSVWLH